MATTVTAADLTVTITETYSLNGIQYGNTTDKLFSENGEVSQRIMSVITSKFIDIINFDIEDDAGQVVVGDYKYFRIKNLDDTNFLTLRVTDGTDSFFIKIKAGESFLLMDNNVDVATGSTTFGSFTNISQISATSDTADIDIEFVCVTT
jgi:hypothetical protein